MDNTSNSGDMEITPSKVIKKSLSSSDSSGFVSKDIPRARLEYDSRLYSNATPDPEIEHYRLFTYFLH